MFRNDDNKMRICCVSFKSDLLLDFKMYYIDLLFDNDIVLYLLFISMYIYIYMVYIILFIIIIDKIFVFEYKGIVWYINKKFVLSYSKN